GPAPAQCWSHERSPPRPPPPGPCCCTFVASGRWDLEDRSLLLGTCSEISLMKGDGSRRKTTSKDLRSPSCVQVPSPRNWPNTSAGCTAAPGEQPWPEPPSFFLRS